MGTLVEELVGRKRQELRFGDDTWGCLVDTPAERSGSEVLPKPQRSGLLESLLTRCRTPAWSFHTRAADSLGLSGAPRSRVSNKFPSDASAARPWSTPSGPAVGPCVYASDVQERDLRRGETGVFGA